MTTIWVRLLHLINPMWSCVGTEGVVPGRKERGTREGVMRMPIAIKQACFFSQLFILTSVILLFLHIICLVACLIRLQLNVARGKLAEES
jgi:hypothetical protein